MNATVDVGERMARIQDALWDLEKAECTVSMIGALNDTACHADEIPNVCAIVEELIKRARDNIHELAEEVREASPPTPKDPRLEAYTAGVARVGEKIYGKPATGAKKKGGAK